MITLLIIGYIITVLIFFIVMRIYDGGDGDIDVDAFMSILWPIIIFTASVYYLFLYADKLAQKIKSYIN